MTILLLHRFSITNVILHMVGMYFAKMRNIARLLDGHPQKPHHGPAETTYGKY